MHRLFSETPARKFLELVPMPLSTGEESARLISISLLVLIRVVVL